MSQDNETCIICGERCGYDDDKGYLWDAHNKALCGQCKANIASRFCAFFGLKDSSTSRDGMEIPWHEVQRILSNIKRDYAMRVSYIVTNEELYEKTVQVKTPVECP